ncbi:MAG: hypothetical protein WD823_12200 [Sulfuricaulis sp.]|uniref:hypothetical protein n=1 Tax=Sulfuricaulis sp. TaxID=2003553 RepID=UPI0034A33C19
MGLFGALWHSLKNWFLAGDSARPASFGNPDLYPIDTERLAKELGVEQEAERLGKRGIPASDAKELTGIEHKIIQVIEKARQSYLDWANDRLTHLNQEINALDIAPVVQKIRQLDAEFERRASALLDAWLSTLKRSVDEMSVRVRDYTDFIAANSLNRAPNYPTGASTYLRYTILGALVLVEGLLNSVFFAQGAWGGLIEGFFYAVLFAAVNIGLAWLYGRHVFPEVFHSHPARKFLGIVLIPVCLAAMVAVALVISHFRDAATSGNMTGAGEFALARIRSTPFELKDIYSWLLAFISFGFAVGAVIDSFGLDDRYPGYGKAHRSLMEARSDYEEDMNAVREELSALKEEVLAELERLLDRAQLNLKRLDEAILHKDTVEKRVGTAFADVDNCIKALIGKFRTSNQVHRVAPPPKYFSVRPKLRSLDVPDFKVLDDRTKYNEQRSLQQSVQSDVQAIRANIQTSFNKQFDRLLPVEEQVKERGQR